MPASLEQRLAALRRFDPAAPKARDGSRIEVVPEWKRD